jgi:hypothetical protein
MLEAPSHGVFDRAPLVVCVLGEPDPDALDDLVGAPLDPRERAG